MYDKMERGRVLLDISFFYIFLILNRESEKGERQKHPFVVLLIHAFIGWLCADQASNLQPWLTLRCSNQLSYSARALIFLYTVGIIFNSLFLKYIHMHAYVWQNFSSSDCLNDWLILLTGWKIVEELVSAVEFSHCFSRFSEHKNFLGMLIKFSDSLAPHPWILIH